jgi:hypothetical protein
VLLADNAEDTGFDDEGMSFSGYGDDEDTARFE